MVRLVYLVCFVYMVCLVRLVYFVCLVYLVCSVRLVCLFYLLVYPLGLLISLTYLLGLRRSDCCSSQSYSPSLLYVSVHES